jgi:alpha-L-fucosidase
MMTWMMQRIIGTCWVVYFLHCTLVSAQSSALPSWDELDDRPLPAWYDQAKLGIFLHWGLFSVPAYGSEWFWNFWKEQDDPDTNDYARFVCATERPHFSYPEYAPRFRAELYRPDEWVAAVAQSGAQYVVINSKHHDGFCMLICCCDSDMF